MNSLLKVLILLTTLILSEGCLHRNVYIRSTDAISLGSRGFSHFANGEFENAIKFYHLALVNAMQNDLPYLQMKYLLNIGRVYFEKGNADSAFAYLGAAREKMVFYGDSAAISSVDGLVVLQNLKLNRRDAAANIISKYDGVKDEKLIIYWKTIRAHYIASENNIDSAFVLLSDARKWYEKKKFYDALPGNYLFTALLYCNNRNYNEADEWFLRTIKSLEKTPVQFIRWKALAGLTFCALHTGKKSDAFIYYERAASCKPAHEYLPLINRFEENDTLIFE